MANNPKPTCNTCAYCVHKEPKGYRNNYCSKNHLPPFKDAEAQSCDKYVQDHDSAVAKFQKASNELENLVLCAIGFIMLVVSFIAIFGDK